jgi:hypothetical protein
MIRVVTSSRSDVCSVVVSVFIGMPFSLLFEPLNHRIQLVEARLPELSILLDPIGHFLQPSRAERRWAFIN